MKVLTRSCYEAATNCSGRIRSDRQRPVAAANRDRPFLSERLHNIRLRYYKGGLGEAVTRRLFAGGLAIRLRPCDGENASHHLVSDSRRVTLR